MRSITKLIVLCFLLALILSMGGAFADSPSERECERQGGTFTRVNGKVTCLVEDPVGQSEHSGGHSQTTTEEESSQGTFNNKPHHEESCRGPGNSGEGGGQCPKK